MTKTPKSSCCGAEIKEVGIGDFHDRDEICTMHWECTQCKKPCDIEIPSGHTEEVIMNAADSANKEQKEMADDWRGIFRKFYDDNDVGGSSRWLVGPLSVELFVNSQIDSAYQRGYCAGELAEKGKALPVFKNFEVFKDKGKHL